MNRALLVVPRRSVGWRSDGVVPLLHEAESGTHAALCAAGISVEIILEGVPRFDAVLKRHGFVVMVRPERDSFRAIESAVASSGGCLLRILDRPKDGGVPGPRFLRKVALAPPRPPLWLSRLPLRVPVHGWRRRASFPSLAVLRPQQDDRVMGRWGSGGPALLCRSLGRSRIWTSGFSLDHLAAEDLAGLMSLLSENVQREGATHAAVPEGARAVLALLHDVEDPLPDDPGGLKSVREGTEGCLQTEACLGFRATYNLVGAFAEQIPDLVKRMVAEGHEVASHGATHREVVSLDPASLREEVQQAEARIGRISGTRIRGFRSPRSRWSGPLLDLLAERGYLWNAELDDSPYPYPVPMEAANGLVRVPVVVDDWGYVKGRASPRDMLNLWKRKVLSAETRRCWVAIGSHPSVLGAGAGRLEAFGSFLEWVSERGIRVMTLGEVAAWWSARIPADDARREAGHP
jgi:peptidoglycan/xylan/chitin deacetylase (PgdA/CDA1 family)